MHETNVENDVGTPPDFCAFNLVILQSFAHREINHWMESHRLINEALQHSQAFIVDALCRFFICK